jgi:cytochrome c556
MRQLLIFLALQGALLGSVLCASFEIDADLMRGIEDTAKSLDSNVSQKDAKAVAEAKELAELFAQIEAYYTRKGGADDAIGFSRNSHALALRAQKAAESQDFDGAADAVGELIRSCKTCHKVYKKN